MPYALCPMPYAVRVPHLSEKGYISECERPRSRVLRSELDVIPHREQKRSRPA